MRRACAIFVLLSCATTSLAHYNMLFPDKPWTKKGEKVTFTYQFGHPFEHELFDAPKPVGVAVLLPGGKKELIDIEKTLTRIEVPGADGKKMTAWRFDYTPAERGDHIFVLKTPPIRIQDEGHSVEDLVKVVLHVQTQNGWDSSVFPFEDGGIDIQPYTRPYGLLPGMVFRGRAVRLPPNHLSLFSRVEIEKYNDKPVKNPPPDELITLQARADKEGFFVTTLPEPGWWGMTALTRLAGKEDQKERSAIVRRATLWVHVDEKK
jgi:uncharacterized GH25 family protein